MNIKEIYARFYEDHIRKEPTKVDACIDEIMQFLKAKGLPPEDICWMDTMLGSVSCYSEEQGFMDGFAQGVEHITGALAFSKTRLQD